MRLNAGRCAGEDQQHGRVHGQEGRRRMGSPYNLGVGRRRLLQAGATLGVLQVASPYIIKARGEESIKLGWIDPLTGSLSALAVTETEGAKYTVAAINKKNGILGRQVELLVEDSANDVGTGVQKARKLT